MEIRKIGNSDITEAKEAENKMKEGKERWLTC